MTLDYGQVGIAMLVVGVVALLVEGALAGFWTFRISRHARTLSERLATEQSKLQGDLERLRLALAETEALWQPYARLLRWLRHPLVIALMDSFVRRWAAAR